MATVAKNHAHQLRGPSTILLAAYGTWPNEQVGYTDGALNLNIDATIEEDVATECLDPISKVMTKRQFMVDAPLVQINTDNLSKVLGITPDGANYGLSGEPEEGELSACVVNVRDDYHPIVAYHPRMYSDGNLKMALQRGKAIRVPINLKSLRASGAYIRFASAAESVTIATGVADRTQASPSTYISQLTISGESAAADALTDIEAASGSTALTDGELVFIRIAGITMPITVTHASDTIELVGAANFVMTKTTDWLLLRYSTTGSKWVEIARRDTE